MSKDILILYSGGADSRLMLELALKMKKNVYCLLVDYEQKHSRELTIARKHLHEKNITHRIVYIKSLGVDSALTGSGVRNETGEVNEMHVPGRNSIFLSIAFSVAESWEIDTIWIGSDWSDRLNLFPDCYQEYFVRVNEMFKFAGPKHIKVEAPLMGMSKDMVLELLDKVFSIDKSDIFSGYGE